MTLHIGHNNMLDSFSVTSYLFSTNSFEILAIRVRITLSREASCSYICMLLQPNFIDDVVENNLQMTFVSLHHFELDAAVAILSRALSRDPR